MYKIYPAIIHNEDGYWVEFPDLPGCQTRGDTLEETMGLAQEALGLYLASLIEHNEPIPAASDITEIHAENGQTTYISADVDAYS